MNKFTNPLDNIHVASPCKANWNEMVGNERQRHCFDCKLNVYNLSGMTRREAENLLLNSEGNLCVKFYRRADGTILTKDCPVGWQAIKKNVARAATAVFSLIAGIFGGVFAFNSASYQTNSTMGEMVVETSKGGESCDFSIPKKNENTYTMGTNVATMGNISAPTTGTPRNLDETRKEIKKSRKN